MDRFYGQFDIGKTLDEQGNGEGPKLTPTQIHEIGLQAVEKALGPQPNELRPWADPVVALIDNERQLETVG
jgi:hypothetical protein